MASSARRLWPTPFTAWLLRHRRQVGLSFAFAHFTHGLAVLALATLLGDAFRTSALTVVFGGGAYVLIALMTLTSTDAAQRRLGRARWRALHTAGMHWIWAVFLVTWMLKLGNGPVYVLGTLLVWLALGVRVAAWRRSPAAAAA